MHKLFISLITMALAVGLGVGVSISANGQAPERPATPAAERSP
jgi:hypothetical protein